MKLISIYKWNDSIVESKDRFVIVMDNKKSLTVLTDVLTKDDADKQLSNYKDGAKDPNTIVVKSVSDTLKHNNVNGAEKLDESINVIKHVKRKFTQNDLGSYILEAYNNSLDIEDFCNEMSDYPEDIATNEEFDFLINSTNFLYSDSTRDNKDYRQVYNFLTDIGLVPEKELNKLSTQTNLKAYDFSNVQYDSEIYFIKSQLKLGSKVINYNIGHQNITGIVVSVEPLAIKIEGTDSIVNL